MIFYILFSLLVLEGVIIDSRTEPRSRISLLLVNNFSLLTMLLIIMHGLKNQIFILRLRVLYLEYKIVL
jgi:hypothetical protein